METIFSIAANWRLCDCRRMIAIQKKIITDEHGEPKEVVISWEQFCELSEALGLDLDDEAITDLREARRDWEGGDRAAFVPLSET